MLSTMLQSDPIRSTTRPRPATPPVGLGRLAALLAGLLLATGCGRGGLSMDEVDTFIALNRIARQAEALRIESDLNVTGTPRPRQRYEATARAIEALLLDLTRFEPSAALHRSATWARVLARGQLAKGLGSRGRALFGRYCGGSTP